MLLIWEKLRFLQFIEYPEIPYEYDNKNKFYNSVLEMIDRFTKKVNLAKIDKNIDYD